MTPGYSPVVSPRQDRQFYADGEIAHAYRPDFKVVYSNGSDASQLGCAGDWPRNIRQLMHRGSLHLRQHPE